ncbi:Crp/Fnr family transcriptional regulator [Desulforhopalus singaporensis]|uniref:cAMP-binding domain of CRP or a regulatory subunit of cAMP-dependent protein kinases n=1 Tax=Desulforhopalus singaporensis TaxID=91360 RepID=A0A1H0VPU9_9BACT|nr:Crp/Fnr family transcriptional regulator [Desulforhopalus singaporensis]SDP80208.1 cAMP-binding domain of CRP or a regulatory subunit of cAMP-dependent protein kinases [Desulforhopalus singaporensis]
MSKNNRDKYKQDLAVFCIRELNAPWREIMHLGKRKTFPQNSEIHTPSENVFYFLDKGRIRLTGLAENGKERVILMLEHGVILGEIPHIHKSFDHFYILQTLSECELIAFPKTLLKDVDFCRKHPHLILNLIKSVAIKAGAFFGQLYDSNLFDCRCMICRMLAQIWREHGEPATLSPNLSQTDIANILGIHRSSVCRVIRQLRDEKIIGQFSKNRLDILNTDALLRCGKLL